MNSSSQDQDFEALLHYIKGSRGLDFTGYKRPSLMRRVSRRMQSIGIEDYSSYQDYLEVHPGEFNHLFNTLLINVTAFFRDRPAWEYIESEVLPSILAHKAENEPIRIWTAGCASGEEAYTLAILMIQALGVERFRAQVKIYATDVDEEALIQARQATYFSRELVGLSQPQIEHFFERNEDRYTFRKDLRRSVIFGRHNLIQDAPISKIDLLVCRNTLMYFNAETQNRILTRFHFALQDGRFLFLGKAEMMLNYTTLFTPVNLKYRVFTKVSNLNLRDRLLLMAEAGSREVANYASYQAQLGGAETTNQTSHQAQLREAVFDTGLMAGVVIDSNGVLILANEQAQTLFNLSPRDLGRPFRDLELSYRPVELRSLIEQACIDVKTINLQEVEWKAPYGETVYLDVHVAPLVDNTNIILGASINFINVTRYKRLQEDLEMSNQELEMAYEELQSSTEELETTNEELQSSNEELETTNEELQSTNEELETMNEELQSTNEELQTVNTELQHRTEELNRSNAFLESILLSLRGGVVVVDRDLSVQIWNHRAEDLWGLRSAEALEQNFLNLDIGLPVEQLRQPIRSCLSGSMDSGSEVLLDAINRRGRGIQCRVTCTPLIGAQGQIQGAILLMEERLEAEA